LSFGHNVAIEK